MQRADDSGQRSETLPKTTRLAKRREFLRVYESGRKVFSRYSVLFFSPNDLPHSRLGITATRKLGKAHVRNRVKRWTREIYRKQRPLLGLDGQRVDVVINVKPNAKEATFEQYSDDLVRVLKRIAGEPRVL